MMAAMTMKKTVHTLGQLLGGFTELGSAGSVEIHGLNLDSRMVEPGDLFLAYAGGHEHGASFIDQAIELGAVAVVVEPVSGIGELPIELLQRGRDIPVISLKDLRNRIGEIAARFYGHPSSKMTMIGVTGTNGKTSVTQFIAQVLAQQGSCGVIGTLGIGLFGEQKIDSGRTTPDAITLQKTLAAMQQAGAGSVVMEVSSHGLDQGRVTGVDFDVAVFTNLSHEHLDYHGDMATYAEAKRRLFQRTELKNAVLNLDDPYGRKWIASLPAGCKAIGYSLEGSSSSFAINELKGDELILGDDGLSIRIHSPFGEGWLESSLLGRFNAANLLAALGALLATGFKFDKALEALGRVTTVPGRMQAYGGGENQPLVVVDYAHTPDALEHVLVALREHCSGHLWCVFGCGGERDSSKRSVMGRLAEQYADHVVVTNDNPRREDPITIIEQILKGMANPDACYVIHDRAAAIALAIRTADSDDVVLVAGKGHEELQCIGDSCLPFSDGVEVLRVLGEEC
jgi:UDP-N-acetylmuramoyl-L-alanyl-D-glutamate--2,6-diaminopimelate ligase